MRKYYLNYLDELESEAMYILREVWAQFQNPVILFSGGKDSIVVTHLARKAFYPSKIPFPLMHIDTGHNFPETIAFRDQLIKDLGLELLVGSVQSSIDTGRVAEERGKTPPETPCKLPPYWMLLNRLKLIVPLVAVVGMKKKPVLRSDFSHRDDFGQWDPKTNGRNCGTS